MHAVGGMAEIGDDSQAGRLGVAILPWLEKKRGDWSLFEFFLELLVVYFLPYFELYLILGGLSALL